MILIVFKVVKVVFKIKPIMYIRLIRNEPKGSAITGRLARSMAITRLAHPSCKNHNS